MTCERRKRHGARRPFCQFFPRTLHLLDREGANQTRENLWRISIPRKMYLSLTQKRRNRRAGRNREGHAVMMIDIEAIDPEKKVRVSDKYRPLN